MHSYWAMQQPYTSQLPVAPGVQCPNLQLNLQHVNVDVLKLWSSHKTPKLCCSLLSARHLSLICCFVIFLLTPTHPSTRPPLPPFLHPNSPLPSSPRSPYPSLSFWEWLLLAGRGNIKKEVGLRRWGGVRESSQTLGASPSPGQTNWQQDPVKEVSPFTSVSHHSEGQSTWQRSMNHANTHIDKLAAHNCKTHSHTLFFHPVMDSQASFGLSNQTISTLKPCLHGH